MLNFKLALIILLVTPINKTTYAETVLYVHTVSYHVNREVKYNENNYGLGLRHYVNQNDLKFQYLTIGTFKNSEYANSKYLGIGYEWGDSIKFSIAAGIITGYKMQEILPFIIPTIRYKNVTLVIAPYPEVATNIVIDVYKF